MTISTTSETLPLVTIGIPCYGRPDLLQVALHSALNQTYQNLEILVHENPSAVEGLDEAVIKIACGDPRIVFTTHEVNIGATANFGSLLQKAKGKYFMWLADDDRLSPKFVDTLVALLEEDPAAGAAFGAVTMVDGTGHIAATYRDFSGFAVRDTDARVTNYLEEPEILGKANLIYGLYRAVACREVWRSFLQDTEDDRFFQWGGDLVFVFGMIARHPWVFSPDAEIVKSTPKISKRGYWHLVYEDHGPPPASFDTYIADLVGISPDERIRGIVNRVMGRRWRRDRLISIWRRPILQFIERCLIPSFLLRNKVLQR